MELYNPNDCDVDLNGYQLLYRSSAGTTDITLIDITISIGPNGFLVYGGSSFSGSPDGLFNAGTGLKDTGGGIALSDGSENVSSVGWGDATNDFVVGTPATAPDGLAPGVTRSLALYPDGYVTGNNSVDYQVTTTPTPGQANSLN